MQKIAPDSKLFNHRRYLFYQGYETKQEAREVATRQKKLGYRVRIVTFPNIRGYFLYERGLRKIGSRR